ncbi:MAG: methionyl-tRNA formyltransferase [Sphingobacteriales bacterium]|jgi:methionyl-tRNA formyltransferase
MKVVFFGTPDFAVASLEAIIKSDHDLVGVVTAPDKPAGRGKKIHSSAVKDCAVENNLLVLQPTNQKNPEFVTELASLKADIFVVVAFRMMPEVVWDMPKHGTFNLHGSLLPQYRGAAPIHYAVINGEKETGVTTFFLRHEIDTGDIILQESTPIGENETTGDVYNRLMEIGAKLVTKTLDMVEDGKLTPLAQNENQELKSAPKIFKDDCKIDWSLSAQTVHNKVRGLSPFPGAFTTWDGKTFKVHQTLMASEISGKPGELIRDGKKLYVACAEGGIELVSIQMEGKKRMDVVSLLNGVSEIPEKLF